MVWPKSPGTAMGAKLWGTWGLGLREVLCTQSQGSTGCHADGCVAAACCTSAQERGRCVPAAAITRHQDGAWLDKGTEEAGLHGPSVHFAV